MNTEKPLQNTAEQLTGQGEYDYIIVGSGAGGGPLAARLAAAGKKVLVLEAGANHTEKGAFDPGNEISRVPVLHAQSSEHPDLAWRFFVDHYERRNGALPDGIEEDPKWHDPDIEGGELPQNKGIFYPRAAGIGGCTIHNAMITIAGPDSDWDDIASLLGDPSWSGERMRAYFQRLEHNDYLPAPSRSRIGKIRQCWRFIKSSCLFLVGHRPDSTSGKHGFDGWLHTSVTDLSIGLEDRQIIKMVKAALLAAKKANLDNAWSWVSTFLKGRVFQSLDPNHSETQANSPEGVVLIPLAVHGSSTNIHQNRAQPYAMLGRRSSPRELLLQTQAEFPSRLIIKTNCLVTRVLLKEEGGTQRAYGVEYYEGERLYRAHVDPSKAPVGKAKTAKVNLKGEVILCGGTFNTPQLLMLSGIGDPAELRNVVDGAIECKVELPGVGKNLQDRYEVSVVSEMKEDFKLLEGATLSVPSPGGSPDWHLRRWRDEGTGLYATNGGILGIFKRSIPELAQPDLFIFGVPSDFRGYRVGYSQPKPHNLFTWVILKSHAKNNSGTVRLRSNDPLDTPLINFKYFGTQSLDTDTLNHPDVSALLQGVKFVREITGYAKSVVASEVHPGSDCRSENAIRNWIRRDAWGHHACGTCAMGPDHDPNAVLNSRFQVRGVKSLRVVDASIFPKIPGYFIVTNIYMASEKAADVILEDAATTACQNTAEYPSELRQLEAAAISKRRQGQFLVEVPGPAGPSSDPKMSVKSGAEAQATSMESLPSDQQNSVSPLIPESQRSKFPAPISDSGQWSDDVTGLALSGGGIRSATMCLGTLQSLARNHLLRRIDFLSTVSGGGYTGAFLGRYFDRFRNSAANLATRSSIPDQVEQELINSESSAIRWLRSHGNYLAPNGSGDGRLNFAIFVRNLLSVHLVVGLALFSLFAIANGIRYGVFEKLLAGSALVVPMEYFPLGYLVHALFGPWFSPWFLLVEFLLLFLALPRIVGYWIVSQDKHEAFKPVPFFLLFFVSGLLLYFGVRDQIKFDLIMIGVALLSSLVQVELAWSRGRKREAAVGTGGVESQRLRTRNYLTYDLGLALALAGAALAFTLIDTVAHGLNEWKLAGNATYATAFATLFASLSALAPLSRWIAGLFKERKVGGAISLTRVLRRDMMAGALAIVLFTVPLIGYSFTAHAVYQGGNSVFVGVMATLLAVFLTMILALPQAVVFVNRSSLSQTYSARLARAYLGASNPARHRPEGMNVTEVIPGDDIPRVSDYKPHEATGPFHLINVTINQTLDSGSRLRKRDRQGLSMAISSIGLSIGEKWHSIWTEASEAVSSHEQKLPVGLQAIGQGYAGDHPLIDELGRDADRAEMLSLRQWIGISGAAIDPGRGRTTNTGIALLMGLVNLRTGHWWDSGIAESARTGFPDISFMRRALYLVPRFFATQALLIYEWIARYPGPWERFWHLSDGGFFENLACYELIRRQVPRIVVCDGGADPDYDFSDFAELTRKVRIDFNARIEPFTSAELVSEQYNIPAEVLKHIGTLDELKPDLAGTGYSAKHAALFWVHYGERPLRRRSILLYFKASVTGDEPADVLQYKRANADFPHQSTGDQFFDEPQWESYRKLGEHSSHDIFSGDWFWKIKLPESDGAAP